VRWFRLAAEQGWSYGQAELGLCYEQGIGITPPTVDMVEAFRWYRLGADQGNAFCLGRCHEHGVGADVDIPQAIIFYQQAAAWANAEAASSVKRLQGTMA
jgi:uncharacterized protein